MRVYWHLSSQFETQTAIGSLETEELNNTVYITSDCRVPYNTNHLFSFPDLVEKIQFDCKIFYLKICLNNLLFVHSSDKAE